MAFPATQLTLYEAFSTGKSRAARLREVVQAARNASAAGVTPRSSYVVLLQRLSEAIDSFAAVAAVPGIGAYAQAQYDNPSLDIVAEFNTMRNAAISLRDWIFTNFPKDAGSPPAWALLTYSQAGVPTELTFTVAALAGFRTQADAFLATVS